MKLSQFTLCRLCVVAVVVVGVTQVCDQRDESVAQPREGKGNATPGGVSDETLGPGEKEEFMRGEGRRSHDCPWRGGVTAGGMESCGRSGTLLVRPPGMSCRAAVFGRQLAFQCIHDSNTHFGPVSRLNWPWPHWNTIIAFQCGHE